MVIVEVSTLTLNVRAACTCHTCGSRGRSLCSSEGHRTGNMRTGGGCAVLALPASFTMMVVACGVADVLVVVSVPCSAGRFPLRTLDSPSLW